MPNFIRDVGAPASLPERAAVPSEERVILVDEEDRAIGTAGKLSAHRDGVLHRAFSVLVRDGLGNFLLQRRAAEKYHSAGLWTNSCCGHPRPDEMSDRAAARRLLEEMGVRCELRGVGSFRYRAELGNGLVEHEIDHVFVGQWTGVPLPDPREVATWRWMSLADIRRELAQHADRFTAWFPKVLDHATGATGASR